MIAKKSPAGRGLFGFFGIVGRRVITQDWLKINPGSLGSIVTYLIVNPCDLAANLGINHPTDRAKQTGDE
jgi:hypothetical protein